MGLKMLVAILFVAIFIDTASAADMAALQEAQREAGVTK